MALSDYIHSSSLVKQDVTEERLTKILPALRTRIAFWREYPDLFIDEIKGEDCPFKFYYYQRLILRTHARFKNNYDTFPRALGKSFSTILSLFIRCVLYPGSHIFVTTGGKFYILPYIMET